MAKGLLNEFNWELIGISWIKNGHANALAKLTSAKATINNQIVMQETLCALYIDEVMCMNRDDA